MRKRQILLLFIAIWLAIIIPACRQKIQPVPSVENPVIVDPPRVSRTVFTNWVEIEVVYTVRWLDGYKPLFEMAKPEDMSFDPFELDPIKSQKTIKINERRYKKENYADLVYYLRYIDEKKGEVVISEQTFHYIKQEPGKSDKGAEAKELKAPGIMLRYDSVLTKGADDIMDRVDFGSFKRQEYFWKGLSGGMALLFAAVLFLLFRKPVVVETKKTGKSKTAPAGKEAGEQELLFTPQEALIYFDNKLIKLRTESAKNPDSQNSLKIRGRICNELRRLLLHFVPDLLKSDTPGEIKTKISQMPKGIMRVSLVFLANWAEYYDDILHKKEDRGGLVDEINKIRELAGNLRKWAVWRYNMRQKWQKLATRRAK